MPEWLSSFPLIANNIIWFQYQAVGRCLLWSVCSLDKTLLVFVLFILHSKAKLACYSRYLVATYFCIPNTNEWWHCYICWEGVQMNMCKNGLERDSIFLSPWVESYYRLSFALSSLSALQEPNNLWQLSYSVLYEGCFNHRPFCWFSLSLFLSKHFIILSAETPPLLI